MTEKFLAVAQFYEPFQFGGDLHPIRAFELEGEPIRCAGFDCYLTLFNDRFRVYEKKTGGLLGDGPSEGSAKQCARRNVKITPDLKKQMKRMGSAKFHKRIATKDALRRLKNCE